MGILHISNIHMDADMDMEYGYTWSVETLRNVISVWIQIWIWSVLLVIWRHYMECTS